MGYVGDCDFKNSRLIVGKERGTKKLQRTKFPAYFDCSEENSLRAKETLKFYLPSYMAELLGVPRDDEEARAFGNSLKPIDWKLKDSNKNISTVSSTSIFMDDLNNNLGGSGGNNAELPRVLYIDNLDQNVTEEFISSLFGQIGRITRTKVIFNFQSASEPYAFVEFADHQSATQALQAMNKRMLMDKEMKVNWAAENQGGGGNLHQSQGKHRYYHVFVGDLSSEVDSKALKDAFTPFGEVSDVKIIRDPQTFNSKGYGFVSFPEREQAERAIEQMNGRKLGRRTIRTNWATRKPNDNDYRFAGYAPHIRPSFFSYG